MRVGAAKKAPSVLSIQGYRESILDTVQPSK
jgi:hypothetical protein